MDPERIAPLTRLPATRVSTRRFLTLLAAGGLSAAGGMAASAADNNGGKGGGKGSHSGKKDGGKGRKKGGDKQGGADASAWFGFWNVFHGTTAVPDGSLFLRVDKKSGPSQVRGLWTEPLTPPSGAKWVVDATAQGAGGQTLSGTFETTDAPQQNLLGFSITFSNAEKTHFTGYYWPATNPAQRTVFGGIKQ